MTTTTTTNNNNNNTRIIITIIMTHEVIVNCTLYTRPSLAFDL